MGKYIGQSLGSLGCLVTLDTMGGLLLCQFLMVGGLWDLDVITSIQVLSIHFPLMIDTF